MEVSWWKCERTRTDTGGVVAASCINTSLTWPNRRRTLESWSMLWNRKGLCTAAEEHMKGSDVLYFIQKPTDFFGGYAVTPFLRWGGGGSSSNKRHNTSTRRNQLSLIFMYYYLRMTALTSRWGKTVAKCSITLVSLWGEWDIIFFAYHSKAK